MLGMVYFLVVVVVFALLLSFWFFYEQDGGRARALLHTQLQTWARVNEEWRVVAGPCPVCGHGGSVAVRGGGRFRWAHESVTDILTVSSQAGTHVVLVEWCFGCAMTRGGGYLAQAARGVYRGPRNVLV